MSSNSQGLGQLPALDLARLNSKSAELSEKYEKATPFPHIMLDDFLDVDISQAAMDEFPPLDGQSWNSYVHVNEKKFSQTDPSTWGPTLQRILAQLNSDEFVAFLTQLTGIKGLFADPSLEGGGLHQSTVGGFLNIHADFTVHPRHRDWSRRVNLLLYLNEDWRPEYGGNLELWSTDMKQCEVSIPPIANRVVIFTTNMDSFHGHPDPMQCPEGVGRKSLALYYFVLDGDSTVRSTEYRSRPGDGAKSALIYLDKYVLRAVDWGKRHLGVSDEAVQRVMKTVSQWGRKSSDD